ncbi:ComEC/Rec2 family competence protein [Magnetovibrio sp. PR-2]|uniref:ComEC/Rec2 family competence protein n=1 Tax=Magnetovibrio sp. PR-2 TaxID=3120356 RepID=UPI002FCE2B73
MAERHRWALWSPVLLGTGIGLYFALPFEPAGAFGFGLLVILGIFWAISVLRFKAVSWVFLALVLISLGLVLAMVRTWWVAAPALIAETGPVTVQGQVERIEDLERGKRVTLSHLTVTRLSPDLVPERARIRLSAKVLPPFQPGDWLEMRANLAPPPPPAMPGAFDFQRHSYFQGIGAVGFSFGAPKVVGRAPVRGINSLVFKFNQFRLELARSIQASEDGATGKVAAALMTGQRGTIPEGVMEDMRQSGLAHLLAISGLHVGLIAGLVFFALRGALALWPSVALSFPIKKWAAVGAIAAAFGYALLAGATVPTQRAFMMVSLVLLAVLFERKAVSMRLVMWAALVILVLSPESVLGASFQMSFSAVVALVAVYEALRTRGLYAKPAQTLWGRVGRYLLGVAITTAVAGLATGLFAAFHFNRVADFGLAANVVAVPVMALWIMPWAIVGFVLMPLGLESLALTPMGWGIDVVLATAHEVASWPGSVTLVPAFPVWGLSLMVLGALWLALWRGRVRALGAPLVALGLVGAIGWTSQPDVLIHQDGKLAAVVDHNGEYVFSTLRSAKFERAIWQRRAGAGDTGNRWQEMAFTQTGVSCDAQGCLYRLGGGVVAFAKTEDAQLEDCALADVVVVDTPLNLCQGMNHLISQDDLAEKGTHAIWFNAAGNVARIETVNGARGDRPWVIRETLNP